MSLLDQRLESALQNEKQIRVIGFDDAPFSRRGHKVHVSGVVCSNTRIEGMLWTKVRRDGWNATKEVQRSLYQSKFLAQLQLVLLDGVAFGGFNVVDIRELSRGVALPVVTVMRHRPDMAAIARAVGNLPQAQKRMRLIRNAGPLYEWDGGFFQVVGARRDLIPPALARLTDRGNVPEALRLAHLIGSAVMTGESGNRA